MKLVGQAMLVFGLVISGFLLLFYLPSDSFMHSNSVLAGLIAAASVALAGAAITIRYALRKDEYPEMLLDGHKHGMVLESGGVKMMLMGSGRKVPLGGRVVLTVLVENVTSAPRDATISLGQVVRLSVKQSGNLTYPQQTFVHLEDGEVAAVHIPVEVAWDASTGRYIMKAQISARSGAEGRRVRQREGYSLGQSEYVFWVEDRLLESPEAKAALRNQRAEVVVESIWRPGLPESGGITLQPSGVTYPKRALAILVLLLILGGVQVVGAVLDARFAMRCSTTEGRIVKLEKKT